MIVSSKFDINTKDDAVVVIGNFDGVHLGHQSLFNKAFELAEKHDLKKICVTFEPHPKEYFSRLNNTDKLPRLTLFKDKCNLLIQSGFDLVWIMKFNKITANLSPNDFIKKLADNFNSKLLLVGQDFKFGKDRAGNIELLQQAARDYNFELVVAQDYLIDNQRVSSNLIREQLDSGKLSQVKKHLGRNYGFTGRVVEGQKKGRQIGYPTVNINVKPDQLLLAKGVYAVYITYKTQKYKAMANWGVRPTLSETPQLVLEAHMFDFNQNIYGQEVTIEFIEKVRDEKKFSSLMELQSQLAEDARVIKKILEDKV